MKNKIWHSIIILFLIGHSVYAQYNWNTVRIGGGGSVPGMIAHPMVQNLYYARTDVGNCYRWDATNEKWVGLLNSVKNSEWWRGAAADIAIDPSEASGNTVYITVGKFDWAGNGGVWKSTDRGANWTRLNLNIAVGANQDQTAGQRLAVNPSNSNIIILTTKANGTQRSTNGGTSWAQVNTTNGRFVVFDPINTNIVYLGHANGILRSTDGGATFSAMSGAPSAVRRASMHSSGVMYVTTQNSVNKWNGSTWTAITPGGTADYGAIAVNPQNANQVIVSKFAWRHNLDMYRSSNGGASWTLMNKTRDVTEAPWSPGHHFAAATFEILWDPFNQNRVWFSDWYNTWETYNPWASTVVWKAHAEGHEEMVTVGALACPPSGDNLLLSGVADIGGFDHTSLTTPPSKTIWGAGVGSGNLSTGVAFQETNPNFIARVGRHDWGGPGFMAYSTNGGTSYTNVSNVPGTGGRIAVSANSTTMVWATQNGGVFYSTNSGSSWSATSGLPSTIIGGSNVFTYIQPLAADKVSGNTFYVYNSGKFYRSTNGSSFTTVNSSLPSLDNRAYINVVTVPDQAGTIYLGLNHSGLRRSTDGGTTWSTINGVSTARLVTVGKGSGSNPAVYVFGFVNSVEGIFRSDDNGATWIKISTNEYEMGMEPNIMAADRNVFGRVFVGTNGNGIMVGAPSSNNSPIVSLTAPASTNFETGNNITITANATASSGNITKVEFFAGTTKIGEKTSAPYTISWSNVPEGTHVITAKATDDKGASTTSAGITIQVKTTKSILVKRTLSDVTINGTINEPEWELSEKAEKLIIGTSDNQVSFGALYDNNYLYIAIEVKDNHLFNDSQNIPDDDGVEIYIDGNKNRGTTYDAFDRQIIKVYERTTILEARSLTQGILHAYSDVSDGYDVEVAIPWSNLGLTPEAGLSIGFDIANNDDDNGETRDGQLMWNGTNDNWRSTADFGTLTLSDETTGLITSLTVNNASASGIKLYPQPASEFVTLEFNAPTSGMAILKVDNMAGNQLISQQLQVNAGINIIRVKLDELPAGMYIYNLLLESENKAGKIIIK